MDDVKFLFSTAQSQGERPYQEDDFCSVSFPSGLAVCVTDGLGGYNGGALASKLATDMFLVLVDELHSKEKLKNWVCQSSDAIEDLGKKDETLKLASTTAIGATFGGSEMSFISVGDSLLVKVSVSGRCDQINIAHEARGGGLTSFLGWGLNQINTDSFPVEQGDWFILASDGLETILDEGFGSTRFGTISKILSESTPENAADNLVKAVLAVGDKEQDNVTVVAIKVGS